MNCTVAPSTSSHLLGACALSPIEVRAKDWERSLRNNDLRHGRQGRVGAPPGQTITIKALLPLRAQLAVAVALEHRVAARGDSRGSGLFVGPSPPHWFAGRALAQAPRSGINFPPPSSRKRPLPFVGLPKLHTPCPKPPFPAALHQTRENPAPAQPGGVCGLLRRAGPGCRATRS